ncbi:MAG TPA: FAD/NAD(P)-binding protein, partial [Planctomycetota bacterium]|nr:FAD/NAD(P)-binding protein [Planctomycetota bacterium]
MKTIVVGAGIFGVTAARELARRGHEVVLVDIGPIPHPLAASTDVSKVVRLEYGP